MSIWLSPVLAVAVYVAMRWLPSVDPRAANYSRFGSLYLALRIGAVALMTLLYALTHMYLRGGVRALDPALIGGLVLGAVLILLGIVLPKLHPTWFVGIRTPWTLTSERSWYRTHQLGRWVFVALGGVQVVAALGYPHGRLGTSFPFLVAIGLAALVVYSYVEWKKDPERQQH